MEYIKATRISEKQHSLHKKDTFGISELWYYTVKGNWSYWRSNNNNGSQTQHVENSIWLRLRKLKQQLSLHNQPIPSQSWRITGRTHSLQRVLSREPGISPNCIGLSLYVWGSAASTQKCVQCQQLIFLMMGTAQICWIRTCKDEAQLPVLITQTKISYLTTQMNFLFGINIWFLRDNALKIIISSKHAILNELYIHILYIYIHTLYIYTKLSFASY